MSLIELFRRQLAALPLPPGQALVAVSGGPDSVALLDLLVQTRDAHGLDLVVAHVDHGIHPDSPRVAKQVQALAESYHLPVHIGQLALGPDAGETEARIERYAWLEALRSRLGAGVILTAPVPNAGSTASSPTITPTRFTCGMRTCLPIRSL